MRPPHGTCPDCGEPLGISNAYGHCGACHLTFSGLGAFDKHRRGAHDGGRHCVDPATDVELTEKGKRKALWWQDARGRWHEGERDPRFTTKETDDDEAA